MKVLAAADAATYSPHSLHAEERIWLEKNCYIDLWIELLHAQSLDPIACLPFVIALDFEGDQWTFFKPSHTELFDLYGVDVQELTVWRPLIEHAIEHLGAGKLISTEADAFWMPDTAGTDYRRAHTKTTIVLNEIDVENRRLGYFHNAGYYSLEGEDFTRLFRLDEPEDPAFLPLFAELVKVDRAVRLSHEELVSRSIPLLKKYFDRRPATNPVQRFAERFQEDIGSLQSRGLEYYHKWAFGTIRQLGAAFELAAAYLTWAEQPGSERYRPAVTAFEQIASANKTLILKAARSVNSKRALDAAPMFREMVVAWDQGMDALGSAIQR